MKRAAILAVVLCAATALAQVHGVPASVTSQSPGKPAPGIPASVTSLGPRGFSGGFSGTPLPAMPSGNFTCFGGGIVCAPGVAPVAQSGRRHHRGNGNGGGYYPNFYPGYSTYPAYPYLAYPDTIYSGDELPVPGYMQPAYSGYGQPSAYAVDPTPDPPAPTIFERRPTSRPYARDEARYDQDYVAPAQQSGQRSKSVEIGVGQQEATTLVFRDGRKQEVHNYAIVGKTLFNFDGTGPFKVLLADLDIPATEKLNGDVGVDFKIPSK